MNILLTGSGGFIGKNLKEYLKDKYVLLCPRSYELNMCDSSAVQNYFKQYEIDFVIHCGTVGGDRFVADKDTTVDDNIAMVDNILENKKKETKVILFGSGAMYDKTRNLHKVKESEIGNYIPQDLYGKSKMLIAQKIKDRRDVVMLNIFACYGYDEKESRFPSYAINQALRNEDIVINQNVIFDYLWVEDVQKIVEYFIENDAVGNIINITPTQSVSLLEIAHYVNKISDCKSEIIIKNPVLNNEYTGDNELLLKNMPSLEFTSIFDGLEKMYRYKKICSSI